MHWYYDKTNWRFVFKVLICLHVTSIARRLSKSFLVVIIAFSCGALNYTLPVYIDCILDICLFAYFHVLNQAIKAMCVPACDAHFTLHVGRS